MCHISLNRYRSGHVSDVAIVRIVEVSCPGRSSVGKMHGDVDWFRCFVSLKGRPVFRGDRVPRTRPRNPVFILSQWGGRGFAKLKNSVNLRAEARSWDQQGEWDSSCHDDQNESGEECREQRGIPT